MRKIILLILLNVNLMCIAQTKEPKVLFERENLNKILSQEKDSKTYLDKVTIYDALYLISETSGIKDLDNQKIEFSIVYHYFTESDTDVRGILVGANFVKEKTGYKIYESGSLDSWAWRESNNHPLQPMSYQESGNNKPIYVGNSDNKELMTVKVWEYAKTLKEENK